MHLNKVLLDGEIVKKVYETKDLLVLEISVLESQGTFIKISINGLAAVEECKTFFVGSKVKLHGSLGYFYSKKIKMKIPQIICESIKLISLPKRFTDNRGID